MSDQKYDYVVVGAGPAGCVLANRLTGDPGRSVALLEAGQPDKAREIHIPAAFSKLFAGPYDWNYHTAKQPQMADRELFWPRGKTLGGSTAINAMMWVRGHQVDYDDWGRECPGWSYEDVLPYFHRVEHRAGAKTVYGTDGPLWISDLRTPNPATLAFLAACAEQGLHKLGELNEPDNTGYGLTPVTQHRGRRFSAADAYLVPAAGRPNLEVVTGAFVERIELTGDRATGVVYRTANGGTRRVTAEREVILCAGAVNTPQLLMLSGIGDPDALRHLGIPVTAEAPQVGRNLQNHPGVDLQYSARSQDSLTSQLGPLGQARLAAEWALFRRGLGADNYFEAGAFLRTRDDVAFPNMQYEFLPLTRQLLNGKLTPVPGFQFWFDLSRPESRGEVTLRTVDPHEAPSVVFHHYQAGQDLTDMIDGIRLARELVHQQAWDRYRGQELNPGDDVRTDAEIAEFVRHRTGTSYHPSGTCRMGTDPHAVVDSQGRVKTIAALRIVDASIMPRVITGNLNAPVMMMAEKIADRIRGRLPLPASNAPYYRSQT
jgi:choline dehydrogenase